MASNGSDRQQRVARSGRDKASKPMLLLAACIAVAALYFAQEVLIPLALAILFTFLLAPLVGYLERRRVPRVPAVLTVVVGVFLLIGLLAWAVVGQAIDLASSIDQYRGNITTKIERLQPKGGLLSKLSKTTEEIGKDLNKPATAPSATRPSEVVAAEIAQQTDDPRVITEATQGKVPNPATQPTEENPLPVAVVQPRPSPMQSLGKYVGLVLGPLGTFGIVIVFVIFMLLQREDLRDRLIRLIGYSQLHMTTRALDDAAERISRYLLAQAIVNGTYGVAIAIGLWVIGRTLGDHPFPNVLLWGLLCAVLRFIPYIGPWIAAAFPIAVSFAVYPGFGVFVAVIVLFVVIELLSNNFMEPWLYGSSTGMSTIAILVSAVFWTWLWGPIGLLLSTPLTVCLVVTGKYVPQLAFLDVLLGDEPVLQPHERIYQRLLAMDQEEAAELADDYLDEMTLEDLYDKVLLPVLAQAEQDRYRGKLDDTRQAFVVDAMADIVDETMERNRAKRVQAAAAMAEAEAKGTPREEAAKEVEPIVDVQRPNTLPVDTSLSVVCLPAHDPPDEIVATMLGNALEIRGYRVKVVSVTALASEMVQTVEQEAADLVVVSALPPAAVTHARYLCKRLHAKFPEIDTLVGLWTWKGDPDKAKGRIACTRTVRLVTSLCQAIDEIHQAAQPMLVKQTAEREASGNGK